MCRVSCPCIPCRLVCCCCSLNPEPTPTPPSRSASAPSSMNDMDRSIDDIMSRHDKVIKDFLR